MLKDSLFNVVCPKCKDYRELNYKMYWYVKKHPETTCKSCCVKNMAGLKKGHGWNKGLKGYMEGHKPYFLAYGEDNPAWKDRVAGYVALHYWVRRQLGKPLYCSFNQEHLSKRFVWANISGDYKRDLDDWHSLCSSCNKKDGILMKYQFDEKLHRRESI